MVKKSHSLSVFVHSWILILHLLKSQTPALLKPSNRLWKMKWSWLDNLLQALHTQLGKRVPMNHQMKHTKLLGGNTW